MEGRRTVSSLQNRRDADESGMGLQYNPAARMKGTKRTSTSQRVSRRPYGACCKTQRVAPPPTLWKAVEQRAK
jgi:hypothetical protein